MILGEIKLKFFVLAIAPAWNANGYHFAYRKGNNPYKKRILESN
jgi:hypothetical protein